MTLVSRLASLAVASLVALASLPASAASVTIFDDGFDADSAGVSGYSTVTNLTNWNVLQGNVDALGTAYGCTGCIDLDGSSSPAAAVLEMKNALTFVAGRIYTFELFFAQGSQDETIALSLAGTISFLATAAPMTFTDVETAGSTFSGKLKISLFGAPDNLGPYLDRVRISYEVPSVPLPAGAPLLLAGIGGLALLRRKRQG